MKKMMMSLKSSRMILHIGEKPIFCVGISSAWAGVVAKLEEEEYDVGLQMEFSLPKSRHNSTIRILDILFSSNHNIHKSLCGLCFWASDSFIDRFY